MEQSIIFSFPDKVVLVHLSGVDISWSSKLVFNSANISVQIVLKWFMERRWKVWEWGKNEREEWRGRKSREGVKEDERGGIRHTHLRKRLSTHSEVGKRCFYCSLMYVVTCVWGRRIYPAIGSKSKCLSSEELGSVRHGKQSCGVRIFCTDPIASAWMAITLQGRQEQTVWCMCLCLPWIHPVPIPDLFHCLNHLQRSHPSPS